MAKRGSSMLRALKSGVKRDVRDAKIKKIEDNFNLTSHQLKSRSTTGGNAQENARRTLYQYNGDDPALKKASKCFKKNLYKGQDPNAAFSSCGFSYGRSDDAQLRKTGGSHKRAGIIGISAFETEDVWKKRR